MSLISDLYQAVIAFSSGLKRQDDLTALIIKRASKKQAERADIYRIRSSRRRRLSRGLKSTCHQELPPRQWRDLVQPST